MATETNTPLADLVVEAAKHAAREANTTVLKVLDTYPELLAHDNLHIIAGRMAAIMFERASKIAFNECAVSDITDLETIMDEIVKRGMRR